MTSPDLHATLALALAPVVGCLTSHAGAATNVLDWKRARSVCPTRGRHDRRGCRR